MVAHLQKPWSQIIKNHIRKSSKTMFRNHQTAWLLALAIAIGGSSSIVVVVAIAGSSSGGGSNSGRNTDVEQLAPPIVGSVQNLLYY
jgi:hypothetical protein